MNESLQQAVYDVLDYLLALQHDGVRPRDARVCLQPIRRRNSDFEIDLLAEEQDLDQSVHYDALIRRAGEGTVTLSYCPERAIPWPLRGVHRWHEGDLVRVNTNVLQMEAAIACLDFIWDEVPTMERLVNLCLIREEVDRRPIQFSDVEMQTAMDRFRAAKKLFKAEDALRWLEQHGMTHEKLESYVAETAILPKLRDRIAEGRVEKYFQEHSDDFDAARIVRLEVASEREARELAGQIRAGIQDFFAAAERIFFEKADGAPRASSLFCAIERRQAGPAFRDELFAAIPGQLIGPFATDTGHTLMRVLEIVPAQLNGHTETAIKEILFESWLAERRQAAQIEWCWGSASKIAATA